MDYDNTDLLLAKAIRDGFALRCHHPVATLVQHDDPAYGWFACYQCDRCGAITRQTVTADDLDRAINAPWLDVALYEQRTVERRATETLAKTMFFFGKAIGRNGR